MLRILKNVYGSTTAPRGLWLHLHRTLTELGARAVLGERCLWIFTSEYLTDRDKPKVIGAMGGHVDDFHQIGDQSSDEWLDIRGKIGKLFQWGMSRDGSYRHAGTDVTTFYDKAGLMTISVDQQYYIETLQDIDIEPSGSCNRTWTLRTGTLVLAEQQ